MLVVLIVSQVGAQQDEVKQYKWGLGLRFGNPSAVSGKKYLSGGNAFELNIGTDLGSRSFMVNLHYLLHNDWDRLTKGMDWYYGIGGQIQSGRGYVDVGVDGVLGAEYTFKNPHFSVFLDIIVFVEVIDDPLAVWFQGGVGFRYNF